MTNQPANRYDASRAVHLAVIASAAVLHAMGLTPWPPITSLGAEGRTVSPLEAAARLDQLLADGPSPAPRVDDATFLRRVHLDLVGQPPTPGEIASFALDRDASKRSRITEKLLADARFGRNWAHYWRDVILARRSEERALLVAPSLTDHLSHRFNANRPWDTIAREFITATGKVTENGETAIIMAQQGKPEETAAEISRIFLGVQIQCAQCHDHPTDRWKRQQFHELAAFFPRVALRPDREAMGRSFLVISDDAPRRFVRKDNDSRRRGTLEHTMPDLQDPQAPGTRVQPVFFLSGEKLDYGTSDIQRRAQLAKWATAAENPWFATAFVNRIWSELLGEGFYEPVDDVGPDRHASSPATLEYLTQAFIASGYDVKGLFQMIMATEAYQRESRPRGAPDAPVFMANTPQRLRADQLFDTLTAALGISIPEPMVATGGPRAIRRSPRYQFTEVFGFDPSDPRDEVVGSIPQALVMMNSPVLDLATSARRADGLGKLLREIPDNEDLVLELYLRCFAREPSQEELRTCLRYIKRVGRRDEAFEDLLWSLLNSAEFVHRM